MSAVLVTGSDRGIGLATVLALSRAGHKVYATMRNLYRGVELREAIVRESLPVEVHAMDVDSDESVASAIGAIRSRGEFIDVLVNNAGIGRAGSVEELAFEHFRAGMETNYFGALRCIQALLPDMRKREAGCVINITSGSGRVAMAPFAMYTASKFALEALSEVLAQEVKPFNIRVAIVEPGPIDTAMLRSGAAPPSPSLYPHARRYAGFFAAVREHAAPPSVVGETIRGIVESASWKLRYPVCCEGLLNWRAGMTDEEWVASGAVDDDAWYRRIEKDLGLNARLASTVIHSEASQ